jgi:hypothetical protein
MITIRQISERSNPCRDIIEGRLKPQAAPVESYAPFACLPAPAPKDLVAQFSRPQSQRCRVNRERGELDALVKKFQATTPGEFTSRDFATFLVAEKYFADQGEAELGAAGKLRKLYWRSEVNEVRRDGLTCIWRFL